MNTSQLIAAWYYEFYIKKSEFNKAHRGIEFKTFQKYVVSCQQSDEN